MAPRVAPATPEVVLVTISPHGKVSSRVAWRRQRWRRPRRRHSLCVPLARKLPLIRLMRAEILRSKDSVSSARAAACFAGVRMALGSRFLSGLGRSTFSVFLSNDAAISFQETSWYRFARAVAAVTEPLPQAAPTIARLSIVVLPFDNVSGDRNEDYLADAITDELTTDLSRLPGAFVIARQSAVACKAKCMDVRQIGRELGVRYVVEGSVRRLGSVLRCRLRLR